MEDLRRKQTSESPGTRIRGVDKALVSVAKDLFTDHRGHMPQDFHNLLAKLAQVH